MSAEIEKIVIHYKEKKEKPQVIKSGLVMYTTNNDRDAEAQFINIDSYEKINALTNALLHSLELGKSEFAKLEEEE